MLESEIKKKSTKQLESWGWEVVHIIQCNKNGYPDTIVLRKSEIFFLEFKQPGKKPEELQSYRHRKLQEQGFKTFIVTCLKDIEPLK